MLHRGNTCLGALFPILKWTGNLDFIRYKRIVIKYWRMVSLQKTYTEPWSHASLRQVKSRHQVCSQTWSQDLVRPRGCSSRSLCQALLLINSNHFGVLCLWLLVVESRACACCVCVLSIIRLNSLPPLCRIFLAMRQTSFMKTPSNV